MSVGILLVTHVPLGTDLLRIATDIFGVCPMLTDALEVENDSPHDPILIDLERRARRLDAGDGVLVLTDLFGSTPANLAVKLLDRRERIRVLAGVNLPMLVRIFNYSTLDLDRLTEKALTGGRDGVLLCSRRGLLD